MSLETVGAENDEANYVALSARGQVLDMNLQTLASNNNGERKASVLWRNFDADDRDASDLCQQVPLQWPY